MVVLKGLETKLKQQVGPTQCHLVAAAEAGHLSGHDTNHRTHVNRELQLRLPETKDRSDMAEKTDSDMRIFYGAVIGAVDEEADRWNSGNHQATGVVEVSKGHAYAIGAIVHQGREHRPVYLEGWHRVYANTATNNWTVSGDVD